MKQRIALLFVIAAILPVLFVGCGTTSPALSATACTAHAGLPDARCTPGNVFANVTAAQVCTAGYAKSVRDVSQSVKNKVYAEYGITHHVSGQYEIDHLVPIEIGGSNAITNLWPEAASPVPGYHQKDLVEDFLHSQVCDGKMTLSDAQTAIATNWISLYVAS
jgi:hypothetical protein